MPWKQWAYLERVTSPDFQNYLQNQTIPQFVNAAQRDSVYTPVPPAKGALCLTADTMTLWAWNGAAWVTLNVADPANGLQASTMRVIAEVVRTGPSGAIGTTALAIPGHTATFTPVAGRAYYMRHSSLLTPSATGTVFTLKAMVGAAQYAALVYIHNNAIASWFDATSPMVLPTGAPVTVTLQGVTNTNTEVISGAANAPGLWQILERGA